MKEEAREPSPALRLVREEVYERMRVEILSCVLRPGSQVQEGELAERYRVSKSPIRDALLRLQEQHLVEVLPRRGYRIKPVSITEVREMYEMRHILERACVARLVEHASDDDLRSLDTYRRLPADIDLESWVSHNREFHTALANLCGNRRLARITRETIAQFDRLIFAQFDRSGSTNVKYEPGTGTLEGFVAEHTGMIEALQRRDKRAAIGLIKDHVASSQDMLLAKIGSLAVIP